MITFNEALNNYYEFKTLYENSYDKEKRDIINNKKLSWNEKRNRFQKLKPKCINCKRPVGTIFSRKFSEDNYSGYKNLSAVCGDRVNPCKLNINLKLESVETLDDNIKYLDDIIEEDKNEIIKKKNELLFGYITTEDAINNFEVFKKTLNETYEMKNYFLELLINKTDNEEKKKELNRLLSEYYVTVKNIGQDVKDAFIDNNFQLIEDTIKNNYVDLLIGTPETSGKPSQIGILDKIRNLKYMYNAVEYDEDTFQFHLVQQKNTIASLEAPHSNEIISYVFGIFESKGKTKKTGKKEVKSKTRKLRIEEETPSSDVVEKAQEVQEVVSPTSTIPVISKDGSVTWKDQNYKKAWDKLSQKHKEFLLRDPNWLEESMASYAKKTQERNTLRFIYPTNFILPPRKLPDGSFDFDNVFYNEIMKSNKDLILNYLKDLEKKDVNKEQADTWFKGRIEDKLYFYLYPTGSQVIHR
jgi:hypothetical protein